MIITRLFAIALFALPGTALASTHDSTNSAMIFNSLKSAGVPPGTPTQISCTLIHDDESEANYSCEVTNLSTKNKYFISGTPARNIQSVLFALNVHKGDGGARAEYVRCVHNPKPSDREYECMIATLIDCEDDILFCRDDSK